jgi:hypothetical protein
MIESAPEPICACIYGLDFTSRPSLKNPIACAVCEHLGKRLDVRRIDHLVDFDAFQSFLQQPGTWVAGIDFPFSLPALAPEFLGWPPHWVGYVPEVAKLEREIFGAKLKKYRDAHDKGQKQPLRKVDEIADSRSPIMWWGVPVGKMFYEGAPRLLASQCDIIPLRRTNSSARIIEAYPALVARRWAEGSYKAGGKKGQTRGRIEARRRIVRAIQSDRLDAVYGFTVQMSREIARRCVEDGKGDTLDSVLCAIQAAWASKQKNFGLPEEPGFYSEGWIFDPHTLRTAKASSRDSETRPKGES